MENDILGYDSSGQPMYGRSSGKTKTLQEIFEYEEYKEKIAMIAASGFSKEEFITALSTFSSLTNETLKITYEEAVKAGEALSKLCDEMKNVKPEFPPSHINPFYRQYNKKKYK